MSHLKRFFFHIKSYLDGNTLNLKEIHDYLYNDNLIFSDIGSTGGLNSSWKILDKYLTAYSFDPDYRATFKGIENSKNKIFNIGLWSEKKRKKIYLTKYPDASSLFKPNNNILKNFLNYDAHNIISHKFINLDSLDSILANLNKPHFIKIDAEGADFEILKGSKKAIYSSVLGVQVEVQFLERNTHSPLFSEIDNFFDKKKFQLMSLDKESWIMNKNSFNLDSSHQLVWADAIYLITLNEFFNRYKNFNKDDFFNILLKLLLISLVYKFYDYIVEIINFSFKKKFINKIQFQLLTKIISQNKKNNFLILSRNFLRVFFSIILFLILFFIPRYRNKSYIYLRSSFYIFFYSVSKIFSRHGPNNVAL